MMPMNILSDFNSVRSSLLAATTEAVKSNTTRAIPFTEAMYKARIAKLRPTSREKITSLVFNNLDLNLPVLESDLGYLL